MSRKIIDGFSVREAKHLDGRASIGIYEKGKRWLTNSALASIYQTKGGCWIVSSNHMEMDAFMSRGEAMKEALRRAALGHRYGEG